MSIQTIIDNAVAIEFIRNKTAGHTVSRSGQIKIASIASNVPWRMIITPRVGMKWSEYRGLVEEIDRLDRIFIEVIDIGASNPGISYITAYQGGLNSTEIASMSVTSASALTITLDVTSITGATKVCFKAGDLIQLDGNYKYPYTVTSDVLRGSASTIEVPINRPFIDQAGYTEAGAGIVVGNDVTWQVVISNKPSYRVVPGGYLEWTGDFEVVEVIED